MFNRPLCGEILPGVQPEPLLAQLEAVPSHPVPCAPGATPLPGLWAEPQVPGSSPRAAQRWSPGTGKGTELPPGEAGSLEGAERAQSQQRNQICTEDPELLH